MLIEAVEEIADARGVQLHAAFFDELAETNGAAVAKSAAAAAAPAKAKAKVKTVAKRAKAVKTAKSKAKRR